MFVRQSAALAALALVSAAALAACGGTAAPTQTFKPIATPASAAPSEPPGSTPAATPAGPTTAAKIFDNGFDPAELTVAVGTTVTWMNTGNRPHTVTAEDGSFKSDGTMGSGATFSHTFDAAGTYKYICAVHPSMRGTVIVTP